MKTLFLFLGLSVCMPGILSAQLAQTFHHGDAVSGIEFIDQNHGVICRSDSIFITHDGGYTTTWAQLTHVAVNDFYNDRRIKMTGAQSVYLSTDDWAAMNTKLLRTTNGGLQWDTLFVTAGTDLYRNLVIPQINHIFYWSTDLDHYLYSSNDGQTFANRVVESGKPIKHLRFIDANTGVAAVRDTNLLPDYRQIEKIFLTQDGGLNWTFQFSDTVQGWGAVSALDIEGSRIVYLANEKVYSSVNAGINWNQYSFPDTLSSSFFSADLVNQHIVFTVVNGLLYKGDLLSNTWQDITAPNALLGDFQQTVFINEISWFYTQNIISCGWFDGKIFRHFIDENEQPTAVTEQATLKDINVYPNPAIDRLYVNPGGIPANQISVQLLDINGKKVYCPILSQDVYCNTLELNVSGLPEGIYLLELQNEEGRVVRKLIIR